MTGIDQESSPESSIAKFECLLQSWNQFLLWDNLRVHYRLGAWRRTGGGRRAAPPPTTVGPKVKSRQKLKFKNS
jgi:hypothetical protein